jgi:high-affinity K+ transport system ATPase subunit B
MLEATIALQLALGKADEGLVIAVLLVLNAAISFAQEQRADRALALLKQRLSVSARVLRDGRWQTLPARDLVPGDTLHIRLGDLVPASLGSRITGRNGQHFPAIGATSGVVTVSVFQHPTKGESGHESGLCHGASAAGPEQRR